MENKSPELVLFCGPPFVGKTDYTARNYQQTHHRVSPRDIFEKNPSSGLHNVVLHVVELLQKGSNVVIDDDNQTWKVRLSYQRLIKKKVPGCKFILVNLAPKHGQEQLLWTRSFRIASLVEKSENTDKVRQICNKSTHDQITKWFDEENLDTNERLSESYGWSVESKATELTALVHFKFELPALFIQWEAVCGGDSDLIGRLAGVFSNWSDITPCGRVFIVADGNNIKTGVTNVAEEKAKLIQSLCQIVKKLAIPVYLLHVECLSLCTSFEVPPNPGILAYLQRRHYLDYTSQYSLYVYSSGSHKTMAERAGLQCIKACKLLQKQSMVTNRCTSFSYHGPEMMAEIEFKKPINTDLQGDYTQIPLWEEITQYGLCENHVSADIGNGCREYLFVTDQKTVTDYVNRYKENASFIEETDSKVARLCHLASQSSRETHGTPLTTTARTSTHTNRETPDWMMKETTPKSQSSKGQVDSSPTKKRRKAYKTMYVMTERELIDTAKLLLSQVDKSVTEEEVLTDVHQQVTCGLSESSKEELTPCEDTRQLHHSQEENSGSVVSPNPIKDGGLPETVFLVTDTVMDDSEDRAKPDLSILDEIFM